MTPDVNVLVAGCRLDHPHHGPALAWLDAALEDCERGRPLAIYPMVAAGFLRLVTHAKVFVQPTPHDAALVFLRAVLNSPGVEMPRLGDEWPVFERLCSAIGRPATTSPMPGSPRRCWPITITW